MASPDTGTSDEGLAGYRAGAVLAIGQWLAIVVVVAGFVVGWIFPDALPGIGGTLRWGGTLALTATPFVALVAIGCSAWRGQHRVSWYAVGTLAVAMLGALLAR